MYLCFLFAPFFLLEANAQITVQGADYSLATQGQVTAASPAFSPSISGNIPAPSPSVFERVEDFSVSDFGDTLAGTTTLSATFATPSLLSVLSTADMNSIRNLEEPDSARGSSGGGSYFNEIVFTLGTRSSVKLIGVGSSRGNYRISLAFVEETEVVDGALPAQLGAFALTGFASVRLLDSDGGELFKRRTDVFGSNSGADTETLLLEAGTYRVEQSGNLLFTSDPVPSALNAAASQEEATALELDISFSSFLSVEATPILEFIWQGGSSTGFNNPLNWKSEQVPGASHLVEFAVGGLKTVELAPSQVVQTARILARSGSQTDINLNGGLWNFGNAAGVQGDLRVQGAGLEIRAGTLESSGGTAIVTNAAGNSFLELKAAGKLRLPDGVLSIGSGGGVGEATALVTGANSLAEAFTITVGDQGQGNLSANNAGTVFAQQNFNVGADGRGEALFSGGAELRMADGGELRVGVRAKGTLTLENGGSALLGENAAIFIGSSVGGEGTLDVRGPDSSFFAIFGGRIAVRENGLLTVREVASLDASHLDVEGGAVFVTEGASATLDGTLSIISGGSLEVSGEDSALDTEGFFLAGGLVTLGEGAAMAVRQRSGETARMLGGVVHVGAGAELRVGTLAHEGGTIMGRGTIFGAVLQSDGFLRPGSSPGILRIEGNYALNGGKLVLEVNGPTPGLEHDVLIITGDFNFTGGFIELVFTDGFAPQDGQTFELLEISGDTTGTPVVSVRGLEPGWDFEMVRDPETGALKVNSLSDGIALPPVRVPAFTVATVAGGGPGKQIVASVAGPPTTEVMLEASNDLQQWRLVGTGVFDDNGHASFDVADVEATSDRQFYRFTLP